MQQPSHALSVFLNYHLAKPPSSKKTESRFVLRVQAFDGNTKVALGLLKALSKSVTFLTTKLYLLLSFSYIMIHMVLRVRESTQYQRV
jgi:hypothetical protein